MSILLINSFPPFISFGIKLLVSIDFVLNYANLFLYVFLLFNLVGFLFYINSIISFFNNTKVLKNKFFYKSTNTPWLLTFLITSLVLMTIIFNLDL